MSLMTALWIWFIGIPVTFTLNALWFRLSGKQPSHSDGIAAMMYAITWPLSWPMYWFILLYFWAINKVCAGACWIWNRIAVR